VLKKVILCLFTILLSAGCGNNETIKSNDIKNEESVNNSISNDSGKSTQDHPERIQLSEKFEKHANIDLFYIEKNDTQFYIAFDSSVNKSYVTVVKGGKIFAEDIETPLTGNLGVKNNQLINENKLTLQTYDVEESGKLKLFNEIQLTENEHPGIVTTLQGTYLKFFKKVGERNSGESAIDLFSEVLLNENYEPFMEIPDLIDFKKDGMHPYFLDLDRGYYLLRISDTLKYDSNIPPSYAIYDIEKQDLVRNPDGTPIENAIEITSIVLPTENGFYALETPETAQAWQKKDTPSYKLAYFEYNGAKIEKIDTYILDELNAFEEAGFTFGHTLSLQDDTITVSALVDNYLLDNVDANDSMKHTVLKYVIPRMDKR